MKNTINKLNIYVLSDYKVIVLNKKVKCDYICLYPNGWKIENKLVLPSPIHYEESYISDITRDDFDSFSLFDTSFTKVYLFKGVKNDIFIHLNNKDKIKINPEDKVNGIHLIKEKDLESYIKYINDYKDINNYKI